MIAVSPGTAHWWANDNDNENLVLITFNDLNHIANQLDQRLWSFFLGGGQQSMGGGQQWGQDKANRRKAHFKNILSCFDPQFFAEASNVPVEIVNKVQGQGRGVEGPL